MHQGIGPYVAISRMICIDSCILHVLQAYRCQYAALECYPSPSWYHEGNVSDIHNKDDDIDRFSGKFQLQVL
jgi:hypothetical protein